jgi:hypothetical protein
MINTDMLKGDSVLQSLSDDQMSRIVELSKNDEDTTMKKKIGDLHGRYDIDFAAASGITKPDGVKSYIFWPEQIKKLIEKGGDSAQLLKQVDALKAEKSELETKIKNGSNDEALKASISKLEGDVKNHTSTIKKLREEAKTSAEKAASDLQAEINKNIGVRVDNIFTTALAKKDVKFKTGIPESAIKASIDVAKKAILSRGDVIFNEDGTAVIKGEDDIIITNKNNLYKPYLLGEQIIDELAPLMDVGKKGAGAGSGKGGGGNGTFVLDATSKTEAVQQIHGHLTGDLGLARGTSEFVEQEAKLYAEHNISSMPQK